MRENAIKRARLDSELVRRRLAGSRSEARRSIEEGRIVVAGVIEPTPATLVGPETAVTLLEGQRYVSRGGDKLDGALTELGIEVADRNWLDAGASTGGFTDRLLQGGAASVIAVDVGYGQFDWRLRNDPRVTVMERTNIRSLERDRLPRVPDGLVADLSFISLRLVIPVFARLAESRADHLLLVKPQFEVGKDSVGRGGVVRDPELWLSSLVSVSAKASEVDLGVAGAVVAHPPGPAGNREFFLHLRRGASAGEGPLRSAVERAVAG